MLGFTLDKLVPLDQSVDLVSETLVGVFPTESISQGVR
jgi:hypothetical protein